HSLHLLVLFLPPPPPVSTLLPYTTLFRSLVLGPVDRGQRAFVALHLRGREATEEALHQVGRARHLDAHRADELDGSRVDPRQVGDRKSTRLNSSHEWISYAVFCLKKKNKI